MDESQAQVERTEEEWRERLDPQAFAVLRQGATERPWSGEYVSTATTGVYRCRACGAELFRSSEKFESHCGWPSFYDPAESSAVTLHQDQTLGMIRTEVRCSRCDSHLGHVFHGEGYPTPTDDRYCINSVSLTLEPDDAVQ
ncbi:peptide-methionine (R)-S-oxide reductase MsrB [Nocardiopsis ansamitocini]|uniref:peptide-methionine (R)-S-oxide reductase n=1 Tax=Nocardiopsis ansamitocini TaxID=1670832 RepID=A0A9W6UJL6_9ACTN|nr:peptide-methionine (R)-S-oxide reductase MsrB [Nocardiopsis ansamitocini]GLU48964.1 peptide-methionine (R)-S-oxide reductase [Nocardiopsis ansamitocini]